MAGELPYTINRPPEGVAPSGILTVTLSVLNGAEEYKIEKDDGEIEIKEGDNAFRGRRLSEWAGHTSLTITRYTAADVNSRRKIYLGSLPKSLNQSEYDKRVEEAAEQTQGLVDDIVAKGGITEVVGTSVAAGASFYIDMLKTGKTEADRFMFYSPNAMRNIGPNHPRAIANLRAAGGFVWHQVSREWHRPDTAKNPNGMKYGWKAPVGSFREMNFYNQQWRSDSSLQGLSAMASGHLLPDARTRLFIPEYTCNQSLSASEKTVDDLNKMADDSGVDFKAELLYGRYDSAPDDPLVFMNLSAREPILPYDNRQKGVKTSGEEFTVVPERELLDTLALRSKLA